MKQTLLILTLLSTLMSCNHQPVRSVVENDCSQAEDSIPHVLCRLTTARQNIRTYLDFCRKHGEGDSVIESFTIRAVDLLGALGMPASYADSAICKYKHVRVYMGYQAKAGFKLYIVPVRNACLKGKDPSKWNGGEDLLLDERGEPQEVNTDSTAMLVDNTFVLDLNAPCPNTCPTNSPLKIQD